LKMTYLEWFLDVGGHVTTLEVGRCCEKCL